MEEGVLVYRVHTGVLVEGGHLVSGSLALGLRESRARSARRRGRVGEVWTMMLRRIAYVVQRYDETGAAKNTA